MHFVSRVERLILLEELLFLNLRLFICIFQNVVKCNLRVFTTSHLTAYKAVISHLHKLLKKVRGPKSCKNNVTMQTNLV